MSDIDKLAARIKSEHNRVEKEQAAAPNALTDEEKYKKALEIMGNQLAEYEKDEAEMNAKVDEEPENSEAPIAPAPAPTEDDDAPVIIEDAVLETAPELPASNASHQESIDDDYDEDADDEDDILMDDSFEVAGSTFDVSDEEIHATMERVPEEIASQNYDMIRRKTAAYRSDLIIKNGLKADEATMLAKIKMREFGEEVEIRYLKDHPDLLNLYVNKEDVNKFEFSPEEQQKMLKVKTIKMHVVENKELPIAKIKKIDKKSKSKYIQKNLNFAISHYSVPLPVLGDYVRFKGAQVNEMLVAIRVSDATTAESIASKANLLYTHMIGGKHYKKFDDAGNIAMDFNTFVNTYPYYDMDMGIYGIVCASSMEKSTVLATCYECGKTFDHTYNVKTLLNPENLPVIYKDNIERVLEYQSDPVKMKELYDELHTTQILESSLTKNQYYISHPSIARAQALYAAVSPDDYTMQELVNTFMFVEQVLVYDETDGEYIPVTEDETQIMMEDVAANLPQVELDMLESIVAPMRYTLKFSSPTKCEHCGKESVNPLQVSDLVFLRARDTSEVIVS